MSNIQFRQALNQALREEMLRDEKVFVCGEEVAKWGGSFLVTQGLLEEFGKKRVLDMPIAEESIVGLAIGAAMAGLRPVAEIMTINFIILAMDQIVNHAAKLRYMSGGEISLPLVIRSPGGGGLQMAAQHSQSLESWFVHVPGLITIAPSTPYDAKGLLKSAIRDDNPVLFIEHEALYTTKGEVPEEEYLLPIGKGDIKRDGKDITIIAYSGMLRIALEAAGILSKDGIEAEIVDPRTLKPLDIETIMTSVKKTGHALIVEECWQSCGVGAEISSTITENCFDYLDAPVKRLSAAEAPMPYNKELEGESIPNADKIVKMARGLLA